MYFYEEGTTFNIGMNTCLLKETFIASPISREIPTSSEEPLTFSMGLVYNPHKNLDSHVIICDYLKSLRIYTNDLEELTLHTTIDFMKGRV